jgi:hypothetical protein
MVWEALTSGGGRLAGVDVADNDDVDMSLLLTASTVSYCSSESPTRCARARWGGQRTPWLRLCGWFEFGSCRVQGIEF